LLSGADPEPLRHQVWELPEIKPIITEYRRHRLTCECCGITTCGELPDGVPTGQSGPRLVALTNLLMGCFRQSKRRTALFLESVLNIPCSEGWVVKMQNLGRAALRPCYDELAMELRRAEAVNLDETGTKQASRKGWIRTSSRFPGSTLEILPRIMPHGNCRSDPNANGRVSERLFSARLTIP